MLLQHIGHAEFLITLESGFRIVTDPFDASVGYPVPSLEADGVLVSHHHHDHDAVENIAGHPQVIDYAGLHTFAPDVKVTGILADHDDAGGAKRGKTLLFLLEAEGLRVVHLGDLGCSLTGEQIEMLQDLDVLMIPVGGHFTIDARQAARIVSQLRPRITIPMHYREGALGYEVLAEVSEFTRQFDKVLWLTTDTLELSDELQDEIVVLDYPQTLN